MGAESRDAQAGSAAHLRERSVDGGAAALEFALVLPLLIALLLGIAQIGVLVSYRLAVTDAARDVARAVALGRTSVDLASAGLQAELDRVLPTASIPLDDRARRPSVAVVDEGDGVRVDVVVPLRDLLWAPAIGEALGSLEVVVRTLKP